MMNPQDFAWSLFGHLGYVGASVWLSTVVVWLVWALKK